MPETARIKFTSDASHNDREGGRTEVTADIRGAELGLRLAVVVPVRGEHSLLRGVLASLRGQAADIDEVIVVDDSVDGVVNEIEGVRVLCSRGQGPYAARNIGWRAASSDVILFCDLRSRPHADWARRLGELFRDPAVALGGSEVLVRGGSSLAARAGERHQFFQLRKYLDDGFFRPYVPTCNLAARREDLLAVGGFREVRSGADADLCWRILDRPGRRLATVPEVLMEWVPRDGIAGYLEQSYRYGKSNRALRRAWRANGAPQKEPTPYPVLARWTAGAIARTAAAAVRGRGERVLELMNDWALLAMHLGFRVASSEAQWPERGTE